MVLIYDPWWLMDRTSYLVTRKYYLTCNGWSPYGIANLQIIFGYPLPGFSNMHLILTILNSMPSLSFWGWKRRKNSCKPPRTRHGFTRDQVFLGVSLKISYPKTLKSAGWSPVSGLKVAFLRQISYSAEINISPSINPHLYMISHKISAFLDAPTSY